MCRDQRQAKLKKISVKSDILKTDDKKKISDDIFEKILFQ